MSPQPTRLRRYVAGAFVLVIVAVFAGSVVNAIGLDVGTGSVTVQALDFTVPTTTLPEVETTTTTTTTLPPTTTTTTLPPTTTTQPPAPVVLYLTDGWAGGAPNYTMSTSSPSSFTTRDVSRSSATVTESNSSRHITWRYTVPTGQPLTLTGKSVKLKVWTSNTGSSSQKIGFRAWVYDCPTNTGNNPSTPTCIFVGGSTATNSYENASTSGINGTRYRLSNFDFGNGNHVVAAGRSLRVKIVAHTSVTDANTTRGGHDGTPTSNISSDEPTPRLPSRLTIG